MNLLFPKLGTQFFASDVINVYVENGKKTMEALSPLHCLQGQIVYSFLRWIRSSS